MIRKIESDGLKFAKSTWNLKNSIFIFQNGFHFSHSQKTWNKKKNIRTQREFFPFILFDWLITNTPSEGSRDFYLPVSQLKKYFLSVFGFLLKKFYIKGFISFLESSLLFLFMFFQLSCRICRHSQRLLCQSDWFSSQLLLLLVNNLHEIFSWRLFLTEESTLYFLILKLAGALLANLGRQQWVTLKTLVTDLSTSEPEPLRYSVASWRVLRPSCRHRCNHCLMLWNGQNHHSVTLRLLRELRHGVWRGWHGERSVHDLLRLWLRAFICDKFTCEHSRWGNTCISFSSLPNP